MSEDNDVLTPQVSENEPVSPSEGEAASRSVAVTSSGSEGTRPQVTFMGNSYDITAVVAVVSGGLVLFSCVTCNMGYYCLPIIPMILGLVSLLSAKDSVDPERTRLLSWLGIGGGGIVLALMVIGIILYVAFIILMIMLGAAAEAG